jgi:hypothetical protein
LILPVVVAADLGHGLGAGQEVKHDLRLELGRKATLLGHDQPPWFEQMLPHFGICPVQGVHYTSPPSTLCPYMASERLAQPKMVALHNLLASCIP